ncbi:uncharacterized protein LOC121601368 [Anopheles merus]|nr:uncharacterized protein LOC121601368 [Anopheles merus]
MGFSIVETLGPKGYGELCLVPDGWVQGTSSGKYYLLWPNIPGKLASKLVRNANSVPESGWTRQECCVKRSNISSYETGTKILAEMSDESSTDYMEQGTTQHITIGNYEQIFAQRVLENDAMETVNYDLDTSNFHEEYLNDHLENENVPEENSKCSHCPCFEALVKFQKEAYEDLQKGQQKILKKMSIIERQNEMLLNTTAQAVEVNGSNILEFEFNRLTNKKDLMQCDERLGETDYFQQVLDWLKSKIIDTDAENRMLEALDLIFEKTLLVECSWTGIGKGCTKFEIRLLRNLMNLFQTIGSTKFHKVSENMLSKFFQRKLKQAKQRLNIQGVRKPTNHKRQTEKN